MELLWPRLSLGAAQVAVVVKNLPASAAACETRVQSLCWEDPLEEEMAIHYSIPAWRTLMDREAWRATVHRVAKSWTRLKQFSSAHTWVGVSQMTLVVKKLPANTGDIRTTSSSSVPGLGRSTGGWHGNPL